MIVGTLEIISSHNHKQWRGIHSSVITSKGNLSQCGHLTKTGLMENFSWLCITGRIQCGSLLLGQEAQNAARQTGLKQQHLASRNQTITAKGTAKPWHSCIGIQAIIQASREQVNIGIGTTNPTIKIRIVCAD